MSRDSNGNYTLPSGNPVVAGTTILDTWANPTMTDLGTEITASLNRSGKGGMLAGLKGFAGTVSLPGFTFTGETSSGLYYPTAGNIGVTILGSNVASFEAGSVTVRSGDAGAAIGPLLRLHRDSASPADADFIGALYFDGEDDGGVQTTYASIEAQIDDVTGGTEDGTVLLKTLVAGTLTTQIDISSAGVLITPNTTLSGTLTVTAITASGVLSIDDVTQSTSTTTGSIHTDGGLGVAKNIFTGGLISTSGGNLQTTRTAVNAIVHTVTSTTTNGSGMQCDISGQSYLVGANWGSTDGRWVVYDNTAAAERFSISTAGAATFSGTIHGVTASSGATPSTSADELFIEGSADSGITIGSGASSIGSLNFADSGSDSAGYLRYNHTSNEMSIGTLGAVAVTIDSGGSVDISGSLDTSGYRMNGTLSTTGVTAGTQSGRTNHTNTESSATSTGGVGHRSYYNPNGQVGSVVTAGTATSYNTSSDPRLKTEFSAIVGALELIVQARNEFIIGEFYFNTDMDTKVWGYNAHKLIDLQPGFGGTEGAGSRDFNINDVIEPETIVDGVVTTPAKLVTPAGVDQSKRVPILEAAIMELLLRLESLEGASTLEYTSTNN